MDKWDKKTTVKKRAKQLKQAMSEGYAAKSIKKGRQRREDYLKRMK